MKRDATQSGRELSRREFNATLSAAAASAACVPLDDLCQSGGRDRYHGSLGRVLAYLEANAWCQGRSLVTTSGIGRTAIVLTAMLRHGCSVHEPLIARLLSRITASARSDGGIHIPGWISSNRDTCLAMLCLTAANATHRYDDILDRAEAFIRSWQWIESRGKEPADFAYGGAGSTRNEASEAHPSKNDAANGHAVGWHVIEAILGAFSTVFLDPLREYLGIASMLYWRLVGVSKSS